MREQNRQTKNGIGSLGLSRNYCSFMYSFFKIYWSHATPHVAKLKSFTYVQDGTQVLFNKYLIFGRVIWHFHITSYLTELFVFWWLFVMLIMMNLNLIGVKSWTYLEDMLRRT